METGDDHLKASPFKFPILPVWKRPNRRRKLLHASSRGQPCPLRHATQRNPGKGASYYKESVKPVAKRGCPHLPFSPRRARSVYKLPSAPIQTSTQLKLYTLQNLAVMWGLYKEELELLQPSHHGGNRNNENNSV